MCANFAEIVNRWRLRFSWIGMLEYWKNGMMGYEIRVKCRDGKFFARKLNGKYPYKKPLFHHSTLPWFHSTPFNANALKKNQYHHSGLEATMSAHWLPNPFPLPQSGHVQVMALQDIPHMLSCMQAWQILKPHRHVQQKGNVIPQQWQLYVLRRRRLLR